MHVYQCIHKNKKKYTYIHLSKYHVANLLLCTKLHKTILITVTTHPPIHTHTHTQNKYKHTNARVLSLACAHTHTYTQRHAHTNTYTRAYTQTHAEAHAHTHIYTCAHLHTRTNLSFSSEPCLLIFLSLRCATATSSVFLLRSFCCCMVWLSSSLIFWRCFCISRSLFAFLSDSSFNFLCNVSCWFLILCMFDSNSWTFFSLSSWKAPIFSLSWKLKLYYSRHPCIAMHWFWIRFLRYGPILNAVLLSN